MADSAEHLRAAARLVDEMTERLRRERGGFEQRVRIEFCVELATEMRQRAIESELTSTKGASDGE